VQPVVVASSSAQPQPTGVSVSTSEWVPVHVLLGCAQRDATRLEMAPTEHVRIADATFRSRCLPGGDVWHWGLERIGLARPANNSDDDDHDGEEKGGGGGGDDGSSNVGAEAEECCGRRLPGADEIAGLASFGRVFVGEFLSTRDLAALQSANITHVIQAGDFGAPPFPAALCYATVPIDDYYTAPIGDHFDAAVVFAHACLVRQQRRRKQPGGVLIHCAAGVSRSASIAAALVLALGAADTGEAAINLVAASRTGTCPNPGFRATLDRYLAAGVTALSAVDSESPRVASTVRFACRRCRIALFTPGDIVASAGAGNAVVGSANVDTGNGAAEIRAACGPGWVAAIAAGAQALCPKCGSKIGRGLADGSGVSVPYSRVDRRLR
jgi:hypothetical protein